MSKPVHVMIDIETFGLKPGAVITQIGAITFDIDNGKPEPKSNSSLELNLNVTDGLFLGGHVDHDTVAWCRTNMSNGVQSSMIVNAVPVRAALITLAQFLDRVTEEDETRLRLWAHGPVFDICRLEWWYNKLGMDIPWHYRAPRDTRTLFDLAKEASWEAQEGGNGGHHNALDDCLYQAAQVVSAYKALWA